MLSRVCVLCCVRAWQGRPIPLQPVTVTLLDDQGNVQSGNVIRYNSSVMPSCFLLNPCCLRRRVLIAVAFPRPRMRVYMQIMTDERGVCTFTDLLVRVSNWTWV